MLGLDGDTQEPPNAWMAEDAFGMYEADSGGAGKNIPLLDDINDTGRTFKWIQQDYQVDDDAWGIMYGVIMLERPY